MRRKALFRISNLTPADGADKIEFNQPSVATIGVGIKPIKDLLIGFDVEWINWADTNG